MVNFADFYSLIPTNEILELHVIQGFEHINIDKFDPDEEDLEFPWYQYTIDTFYSYYDEYEKESKIHAVIVYSGEDKKNAEKG